MQIISESFIGNVLIILNKWQIDDIIFIVFSVENNIVEIFYLRSPVCSVFIASCFGIQLTFGQMITIVLTATLASVGTAGTPGAGMIMLAMVLQSVGLPVEGIALVAGVDRIFDMGRTGVNVVGDMSAAMIVSDYENRREAKEAAKAKA